MTFNKISDNERMIERLTAAVRCGNISHAYIFEGDTCVDKPLLADCFAKAILCERNKGLGCDSCTTCHKIDHGNHEDLFYVEADGNSIKDEAIEELQSKLKKKPYAGERNIAIIKDADTMTLRAQNRLLKTLEEPAPGTVLLLLSENIENLTSTILSRCVVFHWNPFLTPEYGDLMEDAEVLAKMILDKAPFYQMKMKMMALADCKENAYRLLDAMEIRYGKMLVGENGFAGAVSRSGIKAAVTAIEEARRDLRRGMNVGYTLKSMILAVEEE